MNDEMKKAQDELARRMQEAMAEQQEAVAQAMAQAQAMMQSPEMMGMMQQSMAAAQKMMGNTEVEQPSAEELMQAYTQQMAGMDLNDMLQSQMAQVTDMIGSLTGDDDEELPEVLSLEELEEGLESLEAEFPKQEAVELAPDHEYRQSFEVLLSSYLSCMNGYPIDSLAVTEDADEWQDIQEMLAETWSVRSREELLDRIHELIEAGHTAEYAALMELSSPDSLEQEQMNRWTFVQYFKENWPAAMMRGWDCGRAAMLVRWGATLGWLEEAECWKLLDQTAAQVSNQYDSWNEYGMSYLFGSLYWMTAFDPEEGTAERFYQGAAVLNELLGMDEQQEWGIWQNYPWLKGVTA